MRFYFLCTSNIPNTSPIYISRIIQDGVADRHGGLKRGDQLLSVNGVSVEGEHHERAVELLKEAKGSVHPIYLILQFLTCMRSYNYSHIKNSCSSKCFKYDNDVLLQCLKLWCLSPV
jgi:hypothetical protein